MVHTNGILNMLFVQMTTMYREFKLNTEGLVEIYAQKMGEPLGRLSFSAEKLLWLDKKHLFYAIEAKDSPAA